MDSLISCRWPSYYAYGVGIHLEEKTYQKDSSIFKVRTDVRPDFLQKVDTIRIDFYIKKPPYSFQHVDAFSFIKGSEISEKSSVVQAHGKVDKIYSQLTLSKGRKVEKYPIAEMKERTK